MLNSFFSKIGFDDELLSNGKVLDSIRGVAELTDELIYEAYDSGTNIFSLKNGYFGVLMEVDPIIGITAMLDKNISYFFSEELPHSYFQINLLGSHKIGGVLDSWNDVKTNDPMLQKIKQRRYDFLTKKALAFDSATTPRNYRIFISLVQKAKFENFNSTKNNILKKLDSLDLNPMFCSAYDLIQIVQEVVQMERNICSKSKRYNPLELLNRQCLDAESISVESDKILHNETGLVTKVLQVQEYPETFSLQQMIELLGSGGRDSLALSGRFMISLSVSTNITKSKQDSILASGMNVVQSSEKFYARHDLGLKKEATEWMEIIDAVKNGARILDACFTIMITSTTNEISNLKNTIISLYNMHNWKISVAKNIQLIGLLSMLPMQFYYYFDACKFFKLTTKRLSTEMISMLPLHAEWKGMPASGVLLIGRRGQIFNWNPFCRMGGGNYNVVVFGPSGSGKSVFLQELSVSMLSQGVKVFILDIGQSFKNICSILGGEIIQFSSNMTMSLNPFGNFESIQDKDGKDVLTCVQSIISSMCGAETKAEEAQLEKAIIKSIKIYKDKVDITIVSEQLAKLKTPESIRMSMALFPYTSDGKYGKFFSKASNIRFDKPITVFEFEEVRNDVRLLSVILQVISVQVFMQVLSGDRQQKFMLIVDEAWMILDHCAKFLSDLVRVIRKYGGSLVVCVQNYDDFQKTEEHRTIFQNSTWTVMLKQDEKGLNSFKSSEAFKDMIPLIRSVRFAPPQFAELLIYTTGTQVVGRLVLDPFSGKLFSTDAQDFNFINNQLSKGVPIVDAIEQLTQLNKGK